MIPENIKTVLSIADVVLLSVWNIWCFSVVALSVRRSAGKSRLPLANLLWYWLKYPAIVAVFFDFANGIFIDRNPTWWNYFSTVVCTIIWWLNRNAGDDDDHKKLKKKLNEKVAEIGGKLTVVPEPA